jgi:hypothetical protein
MKSCILALFFSALIGCSRNEEYDLITSQSGRIYRLNKNSGEISLVDGTKITKLPEPIQSEMSRESAKLLVELRSWPKRSLPQLDSLQVSLKTRWRDGILYYIFFASPHNKRLREAHDSYPTSKNFTLKLMDAHGFVLIDIPMTLSSMSKVVNEMGQAEGLQMNDHVTCSSEMCLALDQWSLSWTF